MRRNEAIRTPRVLANRATGVRARRVVLEPAFRHLATRFLRRLEEARARPAPRVAATSAAAPAVTPPSSAVAVSVRRNQRDVHDALARTNDELDAMRRQLDANTSAVRALAPRLHRRY
ncbi:hypothetical protein E4U55_004985 [Claviceps digitariae]|nr:hypothetical protein E4U55_004985 [Claviceps digitariae]